MLNYLMMICHFIFCTFSCRIIPIFVFGFHCGFVALVIGLHRVTFMKGEAEQAPKGQERSLRLAQIALGVLKHSPLAERIAASKN